MLTWAGKDWLAEAGERGTALGVVRAHIAAEVDTRTEVIMSTVSADPWFPLPDRTAEGLTLTVLEGTAPVHDYYADRSDAYVVLASNQLKQMVTDWYVFNESAATLRQTGPIGDVPAGDAEFVVNSAVLFPTAPDGIRGEIALTHHPFADVLAGRVPPRAGGTGPLGHLPSDEIANSHLLDRFVEGLVAGDVRALLTDDHRAAVRVDARASTGERVARVEAYTGDDAAEQLVELFAAADDVTLTGRIVTDWYVFAEYLARFGAGDRLRRVAAMHPVRDGRLDGTFGYGLDE
jgi:hypothetical protein